MRVASAPPEPLRRHTQTWAALLLGLAVLAAGLGCTTGPSSAAAGPPAPAAGPVPVLFVHGHGEDAGSFGSMIAYLQRSGYPATHLLAVELVPNTGPNAAAAESQIAPAVERLVQQAAGASAVAPARVDIVAHSMGAVSSRWYASKLRPDRVRTLLTITGANHGTNALCALGDTASGEMCPAFATDRQRHPVQLQLNGTPSAPVDETPYGRGADGPGVPSVPADERRSIRYLTVRIDPDQWILPAESATLAGAGPVSAALPAGVGIEETSPGNLLFKESTDHSLILNDPKFLQTLNTLLAIAG